MKRNKLFILGIVTVLVALLSLTLVSGTYAKYTSSATAQDSARVAKWDVEVNDTQLGGGSTTWTVDLFSTTYAGAGALSSTNTVVSSGTDDVVAPGTSGSFSFTIFNASEVMATAVLTGTETKSSNDINIVYSVTIGSTTTSGTLAQVCAAINAELVNMAPNQTKALNEQSFTIGWEWAFYVDAAHDTSDTTLGLAGSATVEVAFELVATQVD